MDLTLTDILVCPYCGPPYGLILLAESVVERRVLEGALGCANCYRRYVVRGGVADLREDGVRAEPPPGVGGASAEVASGGAGRPGVTGGHAAHEPEAAVTAAAAATVPENERAARLAALMGLAGAGGAGGRTIALVAGPGVRLARAIAAMVEEVEVVAAAEPAKEAMDRPGVSWLLLGRTLPFFNGSVRGVALSGEAADTLLEEAVRVLHPMARLVVEGGPADAAARIEAAGGRVVAVEGTTLAAVAMRAI